MIETFGRSRSDRLNQLHSHCPRTPGERTAWLITGTHVTIEADHIGHTFDDLQRRKLGGARQQALSGRRQHVGISATTVDGTRRNPLRPATRAPSPHKQAASSAGAALMSDRERDGHFGWWSGASRRSNHPSMY